MTQESVTFRPSALIRALMLPGALALLAFALILGAWAIAYLPIWAVILLGVIVVLLGCIAVASLIMAGHLVILRGPTLILDRTGVNMAAYATGPIPWAGIAAMDIVDGAAGGLRFRLKPEITLSRLSRFIIAMNGGRGGIVISHSYLNAEPEEAMEAAQRLRAESPT